MKYSREAVVFGVAVVASIAGAEPFTYQGVLQEAGMAADGVYDIRFELYDSDTQSNQLGSTLNFDDVTVSGGTFTVDLDFGNGVFDGSARFLFIEVRDGASTGAYTGLLPATQLSATPEAQHALTADTVLNPQWVEAPGVLTYGDGDDRVFINRSSPITTSEYFGVHADTAGFVGMYVSGPTSSSPFYGYSINDQINAYTYVEPTSSSWILNNNGQTALESDNSQNLLISGNAVADSFEFSTPKTGYLSIPATAFHSSNDFPDVYRADLETVSMPDTGDGLLIAPAHLPHGARITALRFYYFDNYAFSNMTAVVFSTLHTGGRTNITFAQSSGAANFNQSAVSAVSPSYLVDNSLESYTVSVSSPGWSNDFSLGAISVVIEYTTTEAE